MVTTKEFLIKENLPIDFLSGDDVQYAMIEFAKIKVTEALEASSEKAILMNKWENEKVSKKAILNSYNIDEII